MAIIHRRCEAVQTTAPTKVRTDPPIEPPWDDPPDDDGPDDRPYLNPIGLPPAMLWPDWTDAYRWDLGPTAEGGEE